MYLETNNDGKCKNENHTKPAIETIDDNKMLETLLVNFRPITVVIIWNNDPAHDPPPRVGDPIFGW